MLSRQNQHMSTKSWGVTPLIFTLYLELCYALYKLSNEELSLGAGNGVHPMTLLSK